MTGNVSRSPTKLGNSTSIQIAGRQHPAGEVSRLVRQEQEVHTITGMENVPRDISKQLNNQANVVQTAATPQEMKRPEDKEHSILQSTEDRSSSGGLPLQRQAAITVKQHTSIRTPAFQRMGQNTILEKAEGVAKNALDSQDNSGSQSVSNALTAAGVTVKTFQAAQKASPYIKATAKETGMKATKVAKGTYQVGKKVVKVVHRTDVALGMIKTGVIRLDKETAERLALMASYGIKNSRPAQFLHRATLGLKTGVNNMHYAKLRFENGINRTIVIARGIKTGTITATAYRETMEAVRTATLKGVVAGGKTAGKATVYTLKTGAQMTEKTMLRTGRGLNNAVLVASNTLSGSNDMGAQSAALALKTAHYTARAVATTPKLAKGVKTGIKVSIKTGKFAVKTYQGTKLAAETAHVMGKKATMQMYAKHFQKSLRGKVTRTFEKAGRSVVTVMINGIKALGMKVMIPLLLVLALLLCGSNIISAAAAGISSILAPFLQDASSGEEINETEWLTQCITQKRNELIQEVKDTYRNNLVANGGSFHIVRFFNSFNDAEIALTDTNINTSIYSVSEYLQYIQPIFHSLVLSEYDMEATESEMNGILNELWRKMSIIKTEPLPTEYCNANIDPCPNYSVYEYEDEEKGETIRTYVCNGHSVLSLMIELGSFDDFLKDYFINEINILEEKDNRTVEEEKRLRQISDYYEICLVYTKILEEEFGSGGSVVDLDGVTLTELTDYACQFIGNPYVWGGNDPHTGADCSGFVRYVYANFGVSLLRTAHQQVTQGALVPSISVAEPGDLIFWSDDGTDAGVYHVAMYLGNNKIVHASNSKPYPQGGIKVSNVYGTIYKIKRIAR